MTPKKIRHDTWDASLTAALSQIIICERCNKAPATDKAHRLKRDLIGWRDKADQQEYFMAAKLCRPCHIDLDEYKGPEPHKRMFEIITNIIVTRSPVLYASSVPIHSMLEWDPAAIYGARSKSLTGVSIYNQGLKTMIKQFCDRCEKEAIGNKLDRHSFKESATIGSVRVAIDCDMRVIAPSDGLLCKDCALEVYEAVMNKANKT